MSSLVSFNCSSLQMLNKTQTRVFAISRFLVKSFLSKNGYNPRTSNNTDIKLGPLTKIDKINMTTSKHFNNDLVSASYDVIIYFLIHDKVLRSDVINNILGYFLRNSHNSVPFIT